MSSENCIECGRDRSAHDRDGWLWDGGSTWSGHRFRPSVEDGARASLDFRQEHVRAIRWACKQLAVPFAISENLTDRVQWNGLANCEREPTVQRCLALYQEACAVADAWQAAQTIPVDLEEHCPGLEAALEKLEDATHASPLRQVKVKP